MSLLVISSIVGSATSLHMHIFARRLVDDATAPQRYPL